MLLTPVARSDSHKLLNQTLHCLSAPFHRKADHWVTDPIGSSSTNGVRFVLEALVSLERDAYAGQRDPKSPNVRAPKSQP